MNDPWTHFAHGWKQIIHEIAHPAWGNFFWLIVAASIIVQALEILFPWRKEQKIFRPQLGLDLFYMFFNMFLFPLIGFATLSSVVATQFEGFELVRSLRGLISLLQLPAAVQIFALFILRDFLQWNIHRILHVVPLFWKLHEVHHSAETMSYPVHLRYHWAENIIYRIPEYFMFLIIGTSVTDIFIVYAVSLFIGHLNHANLKLPWGFLKYIFNTSELHLWHHAKVTPRGYGVNFALSLSLWDWLFGTAYEPADKQLPVIGVAAARFPKTIWGQLVWPWRAGK